jgi:hypothetical protein
MRHVARTHFYWLMHIPTTTVVRLGVGWNRNTYLARGKAAILLPSNKRARTTGFGPIILDLSTSKQLDMLCPQTPHM